MIIEFSQHRTFQNSVDLVDAGNTCIQCTTEEGLDYYIITKTIFGKVHVLKVGPLIEGVEGFPIAEFDLSYKCFTYKEPTLAKEITNFLNDPRKKICDAQEILAEQFFGRVPDAIQIFKNISNERE